MFFTFMRILINVLQVLFFTGLVGCVVVVAISWVVVSKGGFSRGE
ncbi:MAG TPA: hypothetical protein VMV57_09260 [Terracidiphilus sp.]|nr:hypothetical protein [Terracidiphilus sp.]